MDHKLTPNYDWENDAIKSLVPNAQYSRRGEELFWNKDENNGKSCPTEAEIDAEIVRLKAEYTTQTYARNRQDDYPDWGIQLEKIYDDGLTKWKSEMVDPVKTKWPKDNSGPVE